MTRTTLALTLVLGLIATIALGAAAAAAGLVIALTGHDADKPVLAEARPAVPEDLLLAGGSETLAASNFQTHLRGAAERSGIRLTRIEMRLPAEAERQLAALIEAHGTNDQILRFLHDLESGMPAIVTHEARIARPAPLDTAQAGSPLVLTAEFHAWHGRMERGS